MANDVTSKVILGLDPSEFRRGIQQVDAKLKETSKLFGNLGQVIGATFAVGQIQAFATEAIKLGSQLETVRKGFERFGDAATLGELRRATRGLVTDLELMKVAVQAGNFGIPIQQMGQLLEFAARRAAETGQSVDYLVESIVVGIGRKSPLILDNLGISAVALKEKFGGAALEAQSIADVAKAVGEIATAELGKMGEAVDTAADKMQRLTTSWENFKARFGEAIAPAVSGVLDMITGALERTFINYQLLKAELHTTKPSERIKSRTSSAVTVGGSASPTAGTSGLEVVRKTLQEITLQAKGLAAVSTNLTSQEQILQGNVIPAYDEFNRMIRGAIQQQDAFNAQLRAASMVGAEFGAILSEAFSASMINGEDFFETLRKSIMEYVKQMAVALATTTALAGIFSIVTGGGFTAAFGAISQGTGLGNLFGEGGIFNLNAKVKGSDLNLGTQRSGTNYGRIGG
jgi:hypothetical protein